MADISAPTVTGSTSSLPANVVTDLVDTVNRVASKDDRWLFIALLVIGLVFVWILFKYFTAEIRRLRDRVDEMQLTREKHLIESTQVIANNTTALQECHAVLQKLLTRNQ